jgi:hypothetical protein
MGAGRNSSASNISTRIEGRRRFVSGRIAEVTPTAGALASESFATSLALAAECTHRRRELSYRNILDPCVELSASLVEAATGNYWSDG